MELLFMVLIECIGLYCLYGAFYKRFGEKSFNDGKKLFPFSLVAARFKNENSFVLFYKILIIFSLLSMLGLIIFYLNKVGIS